MERRSFLKGLGLGALSLSRPVEAQPDDQLKIRVEAGANPWTHLRLLNNPDHFHFAIIPDLTGSYRPGVFESAVANLTLDGVRDDFVHEGRPDISYR